MSWPMIAAAAAPYVISQFQDKPSVPGAPALRPMANRDAYINQILDHAFKPDSRSMKLASDQLQNQVSHALARRGLAGSSIGASVLSSSLSDLAAKWAEMQSQQQNQAMQTVMGYDKSRADGFNQQLMMNYGNDLARYNAGVQENANQVAGLGGMINAGTQLYYQDQNNRRMNQIYNHYFPEAG